MSSQYQETLRDISQRASSLIRMLGPTSTLASNPPQESLQNHRHHLTIPLPNPIASVLVARGYDPTVAEKLSKAYLDKASSLKQAYELNHREVVKQCLASGAFHTHDVDTFILATHSTYISLFEQSLRDWQLKIEEASRQYTSHPRGSYTDNKGHGKTYATEKRPTFKNENVPVLETAFGANAYPSRADKELLAKETRMEYKQVNIWFQNRRARCKKEGLSLQRTATFATPSCVPVYTTGPSSPQLSVGELPSTDSSEANTYSLSRSPPIDPFVVTARPMYTFPTPYPPLYDVDPFPVRSGIGSFTTTWLRKRATGPVQESSVDIEHLTAQMASLTLSSDSHYKQPLPSFSLILPRAPLPALIRTATGPSRAQPVATFVSAPGSLPREESRMLYCGLPARLPRTCVERQVISKPSSPIASTRPISMAYPRTPATGRLRRFESRSPSPRHSSRSSSLASITSRSSSSSGSSVSSIEPLTPSTSPRIQTSFVKDVRPSTSAQVRRSPSISNDVHISSSFV